jgi:hypothetical protein
MHHLRDVLDKPTPAGVVVLSGGRRAAEAVA